MAKNSQRPKFQPLKSNTSLQKPYRHTFSLLRNGIILNRDRGSALIFALVFVFVVLATSIAISNRGMFGLLGSIFNQESKLAREAADIGVLRAAMLLNEPRNRQLLVNADDIDGATGSAILTNNKFVNPCPGSGIPNLMVSGSSMGIKDSNGTTSTYPTLQIDDGAASSNIIRKFRIVSIEQSGIPSLSAGTTGGIRITVQGQAIKNGKVVSTSTITRELEVIEKCCGLSLGGPSQIFGGDTRKCDQNNPGLGLIAGTYYKSNGLFDTTGGSGITFRDENGNIIPQVYCLDNSATNDCADGDFRNGTGTKLIEVEPKLNDVPPIPSFAGTGATSCEGSTLAACEIKISDDTILSTADFANWGSATTLTVCTLSSCTPVVSLIPITNQSTSTTTTLVPNIQNCTGNRTPVNSCRNKNGTYVTTPSLVSTVTNTTTVTVGTQTVTSTPGLSTTVVAANGELAELKSHCFQRSESSVTVTYCSLNRIEVANNKILNINTTGGPIRFYFPNPSVATSPSIELKNGQSGIIQTNFFKPQLSYTDLIFFGIPRSELTTKCSGALYATACQQVQLGGGSASSTTFFAYFPGAEVTLKGTATVNGVLWSNIINATGSVNFVTSSSGVGEALSLIGMADQGSSGGGNLNLIGEYITRLTKKFTFF